jgi:hypothetical protein
MYVPIAFLNKLNNSYLIIRSMNGLALMSRLSKKSTISVIFFISVCAILVFNHYTTMVIAWDEDEITAPVGKIPIIDGTQDSAWSSSNVTQSGTPALTMKVMINSSYLFVLIEVRSENHNDNEYVKILLSNSTSNLEEDFVDAKLIQNRNFSSSENRTFFIKDQVYNETLGGYIDDSEINFEGAANVSASGGTHSFYEFKLPNKNAITFTDFTNLMQLKLCLEAIKKGKIPQNHLLHP